MEQPSARNASLKLLARALARAGVPRHRRPRRKPPGGIAPAPAPNGPTPHNLIGGGALALED
jgi:hypothetical protein